MNRGSLVSAVLAWLLACLPAAWSLRGDDSFRRGDSNGDGEADLSDPVHILAFLYLGGAPPACFDASDANDDGAVDLTDSIALLESLFLGGDPLLPPGSHCGADPTDDPLTCDSYPPCAPVPCASGEECPAGSYCAKDVGDCDGPGLCRELPPPICPRIFKPVCGCNGVTYGNACEAAAAGVNVAHAGRCTTPCSAGGDCPPDFYCMTAEGDCEGTGICEEMIKGCPEVFAPVCGCDGVTYANDCLAAAAGVSLASRDACGPACFSNDDCPEGAYCHKADGDCEGPGTCQDRPAACLDVFDPVCGCDGVTYSNSCEAGMAGVSIATRGPCQ